MRIRGRPIESDMAHVRSSCSFVTRIFVAESMEEALAAKYVLALSDSTGNGYGECSKQWHACACSSMNVAHDASEAGIAAGVKKALKMVHPDQAGRLWPPCGPLHYRSALKSTQPKFVELMQQSKRKRNATGCAAGPLTTG